MDIILEDLTKYPHATSIEIHYGTHLNKDQFDSRLGLQYHVIYDISKHFGILPTYYDNYTIYRVNDIVLESNRPFKRRILHWNTKSPNHLVKYILEKPVFQADFEPLREYDTIEYNSRIVWKLDSQCSIILDIPNTTTRPGISYMCLQICIMLRGGEYLKESSPLPAAHEYLSQLDVKKCG